MKTFLEIAKENKRIAKRKSIHNKNRDALFAELKKNETLDADFGVRDGVSVFNISIWNEEGHMVVGDTTIEVRDGVCKRYVLPKPVRVAVKAILNEYPEEDTFGIESFNFNLDGEIAP